MIRNPIFRTLLLATICFLSLTPFFWNGSPSGHDFEFHMFSWMEVLSQWKQGIIYPRWAASAHWGYGEARFLFYPPASWTLGAALGALLPWRMVPGAFILVVLTASGVSMFRLAREWLPERDAFFAAAFYALNPYHLVIVYWRSAYAELLASVLLPLLVWCILRLGEPGARPALWLALVLAAAWLTNAPAAVMIHYSTAGLAVLVAVLNRSWRPLWRAGLTILLGAGLASFYLIPAIYEEKWVNIGEVLAFGVRPVDNFLFTTISDPDHNRFNLLVSMIAVSEFAALALAVWLSRTRNLPEKKRWFLLSTWAVAAALIMFSFTNLLWEHLPKLQFVQLPWRWLLCLNAALALLLPLALRKWSLRFLACAALLTAVIITGYRTQPPWWDTAADIREMRDGMSSGAGYEGTDEYVPAGADPYELKKEQPKIADAAGHTIRAVIAEWSATEKRFSVQSNKSELLVLRLFNYPAWEVRVNDGRVSTQTAEVTGQIEIPISVGMNHVLVRFSRTLDRTVGGWLSIISFAILLFGWIRTRGKEPVRTTA